MASFKIFEVEFEVVKKNPGGAAGAVYQYRRGPRKATVDAASAHPGDILTVLNADITIAAGETIEILSVRPGQVSGERRGMRNDFHADEPLTTSVEDSTKVGRAECRSVQGVRMENKTIVWIIRHIDGALFRLMNQRLTLTLLVIAGGESLVAPFRGTQWAVYALGTAAVGIGLTLAGAGLWLQCLGNSARAISDLYQGEIVRGAAAPQKATAPTPVPGRIN